MRSTVALMGILTAALAAGPVMAADSNPWRMGPQMPRPQVPRVNSVPQPQQSYDGYTFAPLPEQEHSALPRTVVGSQMGRPVSPYGAVNPAYGPTLGYGQPYGSGGGYPAMGYPGLGYPGTGYPGTGYPGYGWGGPVLSGGNGLTGPLSMLPFW
jgi:hypothetical protein